MEGKGNNKGYGSKGTKRKAIDPAEAAGGQEDQASAKQSSLPDDFLEMIAQAKREKEENEEIERLRKEVEQQEGEASIAAHQNSPFENKKRQSSAKPKSAQKQSRCAATLLSSARLVSIHHIFFFCHIFPPTCHHHAQETIEIIIGWLQTPTI